MKLVNRNIPIILSNTSIPTCDSDTDKNVCAIVKEYERQIDQLVYRLYNSTNEKIKIVESNLVR